MLLARTQTDGLRGISDTAGGIRGSERCFPPQTRRSLETIRARRPDGGGGRKGNRTPVSATPVASHLPRRPCPNPSGDPTDRARTGTPADMRDTVLPHIHGALHRVAKPQYLVAQSVHHLRYRARDRAGTPRATAQSGTSRT